MRISWPVSQLLTSAQAAAHLGRNVSTLAYWRRQHKGPPFIRHGPCTIRYATHHLDAWLSGYGGEPAPVNRYHEFPD